MKEEGWAGPHMHKLRGCRGGAATRGRWLSQRTQPSPEGAAAQADWTRSVGVEEAGLLRAPSLGNSHPWRAPHLYSSFTSD